MICQKCGAEIEDDAIYCPKCGSYVELRKKESLTGEKNAEHTGEENAYTEPDIKEEAYTEPAGQAEPYTQPTGGTTYTQPQREDSFGAGTGSADSQYQYFDWKAASPSQTGGGEKKKSKAPMVVMGVIAAAIAVALFWLLISPMMAGKTKDHVEEAMKNTLQDLSEENDYGARVGEITDSGIFTQELKATLDELSISQYGMSSDLMQDLSPAQLTVKALFDRKNGRSKLELSGGAGDMNPLQIEAFLSLEDEEVIFGFPGLYDQNLKMSLEDVGGLSGLNFGLDTGEYINPDSGDEAAESFVRTLSDWLDAAYKDVDCKKTQTVKIDTGNGVLEADEYELALSGKNYEKHMKKLPEMIENDKVFMGWLEDITSKADAEDFIDLLKDAVDEAMFDSRVSKVILCDVRIYKDKVIQISIPFDSEEEKTGGDLVLSFFGKENVGDDLQIDMDLTIDRETFRADYRALKNGDEIKVTLSMDLAGNMAVELLVDGEYKVSGESYTYELKDFDYLMNLNDYLGESLSVSLGASGSYSITRGADFTAPDSAQAISFLDMQDEEFQELIVTLLENASRRGYVPSAYADSFAAFVLGVRAHLDSQGSVGDNGGGSLDGSENLTFEEFAEQVKQIYGDIYTEEVLRQLYDSLYSGGGDAYNTKGVVYGAGGNPYLFCYKEDLTLELVGVDGFELDESYSDGYELFFVKEIGNEDEILLDYFITDDTMDDYMEYQSEYQREYYQEAGYTTINIGDVKRGMIGGHTAAWIEYSASDTQGNRASGIIAYANIDNQHGCVLDMYSLFGTDEVSEELLMKCFDFYTVEN